MTMPQYENCPHTGSGWCLDCVKELSNKADRYERALLFLNDRYGAAWETLRSISYQRLEGYLNWLERGIKEYDEVKKHEEKLNGNIKI